MGVHGHIQTVKARYDGEFANCVSSWKSDKYLSFLIDMEVDVSETNGENSWEIYVDDNLRDLTKELLANEHNDEINALFELQPELQCETNAKELGEFLDCGIKAADKEGDNYIVIDFF